MTTDNSTIATSPKNPPLPNLPENTLESGSETLGSLLTGIYDDLYNLLAISEFTQEAVEKLMNPEDKDYSHNLVVGLGQTFSWLQSRGKNLKARLGQIINRVNGNPSR